MAAELERGSHIADAHRQVVFFSGGSEMLRKFLVVTAVASAVAYAGSGHAAVIVAEWNFNNFAETTTTNGFGENLAADSGVGNMFVQSATTTGTNFQRSTGNGTTLGATEGTAAGGSIDLRRGERWNNGYLELQFSMAGLEDLTLSWAGRYFSTFNSVTTLSYSSDGVNYTNFGTIQRDDHMGAHTLFEYGPAVFASLDDQASVRIRLSFAADGGAASSGSGLLLDNFVVTAVPEPASLGLIGLAGLGLLARRPLRASNNRT
jgi:hypothetical protein